MPRSARGSPLRDAGARFVDDRRALLRAARCASAAPTSDGRQPATAGRRRRRADGRRATLDPAERARLRELRQTGRVVLDELGQQKVLRAVYSPRQLEEVLVDFWFNHFNVFAGKGPVRGYLTEYERDAIRPHVLGRFRDLLGAVAQEPGDAVLSGQLAERRSRRRPTT